MDKESAKKRRNGLLILIAVAALFIGAATLLERRIAKDEYEDAPKCPTFSIKSAAVTSYNLSADNLLFALIDVGVRAGNPNANDSGNYFLYKSLRAKVSKGEHQLLASEALPDDLALATESDALVPIQAAGYWVLENKIAEELRADGAAGEGRVNVVIQASLGVMGLSGYEPVYVTCEDVVLDFSRSTDRLQRVDCRVQVFIVCRP